MEIRGTETPVQLATGDTAIEDVQDFTKSRTDAMRAEVADAVREGRLTIAFQPVTGAGATPGIAFHEALLRMVDHTGALVPAARFLPLFHEPEFGQILDNTALKRSLQALKADLSLRVSVNVSALSFGCEEWLSLLDEAGRSLPDIARRMVVEFPEADALRDLDRTKAFMDQLARRGVALALDRFAANEIWMSRLHNFRFDLVKFDGRLFCDGDAGQENAVRARSMIKAAREFKMATVAEFVETSDMAAEARRLGIDCLQGFLIGAPELQWKRAPGMLEPVP